jgi:hypothetical protein
MARALHSNATASPGRWRPLSNSTFRNLLASNLVSDIGTFMQSVGAAWLMTSLTNSPPGTPPLGSKTNLGGTRIPASRLQAHALRAQFFHSAKWSLTGKMRIAVPSVSTA